MKIGNKLKALRKERRMTLKELSEKSGVAIATLSRMEHDIMIGTLESHVNICNALGISLADFYHEIESGSKSIALIKQKEKHDSFVYQKKSTVEMLTTNIMEKKLMPTLIRIMKGGKTHKEQNKPGSEKFIYMLEGGMFAEIGDEKNKLSKGDSLYFDASLPHTFSNEGVSEAVAICVLTPPEF